MEEYNYSHRETELEKRMAEISLKLDSLKTSVEQLRKEINDRLTK